MLFSGVGKSIILPTSEMCIRDRVWLGLLAVGFLLFTNIRFLESTTSAASKPPVSYTHLSPQSYDFFPILRQIPFMNKAWTKAPHMLNLHGIQDASILSLIHI